MKSESEKKFTLRILEAPLDKKLTGTGRLVLHYICLADDSVQTLGWILLITLVRHILTMDGTFFWMVSRRQVNKFNGIEVSPHTCNLFAHFFLFYKKN